MCIRDSCIIGQIKWRWWWFRELSSFAVSSLLGQLSIGREANSADELISWTPIQPSLFVMHACTRLKQHCMATDVSGFRRRDSACGQHFRDGTSLALRRLAVRRRVRLLYYTVQHSSKHWTGYRKLCCRRRTARRAMSVEILSTAATVATGCTTNQQQVEYFGRLTCSKLCASSHDASTVVDVVNKLDRRRGVLLIDLSYRNSPLSQVQWDKVSQESTRIFWERPNFLVPQCRMAEASTPQTISICPVVSTQYRLVRDWRADRRTDTGR